MLHVRYTHKRSDKTRVDKAPLPPHLTSHISFLLGRMGNVIREQFDEILGPYQIHCKHFGILATLSGKKKFTQQNLAELLRIDRTSMVALINELEKVGFVGRHNNPNDRRSHLIRLTPKGQDVFKKAAAAGKSMEKKFLQHLDDSEAKTLQRLLQKLLQSFLDEATSKNKGIFST